MKNLKKIAILVLVMVMAFALCTPALAAWTTKQEKAHEIAEIARSIGLSEDDPIIERASTIWWDEYYRVMAQPAPIEKTYNIPQEEIDALARTIWGEARGVSNKAEQAAVAWCVLNRVDAGYGATVLEVVSAPGQFTGYSIYYPVTDELAELAKDVLTRWYREKDGETDVGRTLPSDYYYFNGSDGRNWFRKEFRSLIYWDWSLPDPYI